MMRTNTAKSHCLDAVHRFQQLYAGHVFATANNLLSPITTSPAFPFQTSISAILQHPSRLSWLERNIGRINGAVIGRGKKIFCVSQKYGKTNYGGWGAVMQENRNSWTGWPAAASCRRTQEILPAEFRNKIGHFKIEWHIFWKSLREYNMMFLLINLWIYVDLWLCPYLAKYTRGERCLIKSLACERCEKT